LQQQLAALNNMYSLVAGGAAASGQSSMTGAMSFDPRVHQFQQAQSQEGGAGLPEEQGYGGSSLDSMAKNLAQRYGMPIGRGRLVDDQGNFLLTPQQLADSSGGKVTLGEAAAQMNYISQALTRRQNEEQQQKGIAAMQAGLGQIQSRGRGSAAAMMSGYYQGIADMYANQEYEAADFSYYIQKEKQMIEEEIRRRAHKQQKKQGRTNVVAGVALTIVSLYSGNIAGAAAGVSMVAGGAANSGWF
jgi:hypothetical protein